MWIKTEAIVLSSLPYGESGRIVKCYTKLHGIRTFFVKGMHSKKQKINALFYALNQIEIVYKENRNGQLYHFHEIQPQHYYESIYIHPQKTSIILFLAEILHTVLQEEETNLPLYEFIQNALKAFDKNKNAFADFHLWFLMQLTQFLGFQPNLIFNSLYFDLKEGTSSNQKPNDIYLSKNELQDWESLYQLDFFEQKENQFNQKQRKSLIEHLLTYYKLHTSNFRQPKSLEVLNVVFS